MLKIKDSVNLRELEKYGFHYSYFDDYAYEKEPDLLKRFPHGILFQKVEKDVFNTVHHDRELRISNNELLFDLINAGLVEKVGNK